MARRFLLLLLGALSVARAGALSATVDPRIELMTAVELLAGDPNFPLTGLNIGYKQEMLAWFSPWRGHPAVKRLGELWRNIDGPPGTMMCVSPPPELKPLMDLAECKSLSRERAADVAAWFEMLADFSRQSRFDEFFRAHRPFYDSTVAAFRKLLSGDYAAQLESYYGRRQRSYEMVLGPLLQGNFGCRVPAGEGVFRLYDIMGPVHTADGLPAYGEAEWVRELVWHEFGHSFSNPAVNRNQALWSPYSSLFEPLREAMGRQAYREWSACVYEHANRAHVARIARRELGPDAAEAILRKEEARGFRYIRALYNRLGEYEADRARYKTIDDFAPRLLAVFGEAANGR
jgi:hypothetical protein